MFESSHGRRPGPLLFDATAADPIPSRPVTGPPRTVPVAEGGFDWELAEGPAGAASLALLLRTDPDQMPRSMAVSAVIGVEKGIRLLQALGVRFTAQAVGPKPPKKDLDEACDEISAALNQHPQTTAAKVGAARGPARRLPTTLGRLASGDLSLHQATRIEHALRGLDDGTAVWIAPSGRTYTAPDNSATTPSSPPTSPKPPPDKPPERKPPPGNRQSRNRSGTAPATTRG